MELVDIGFNFTSSAFRKDADEVVTRAKQAGPVQIMKRVNLQLN